MIAILCTIAVAQAGVTAPNDLLLYWNFDQGQQELVRDLSGNGLHGKVDTSWVQSPAGRAVMMDGTSRSIVSVRIPEGKRFGRRSWTFMAMVKPIKLGIDSTQNQRRIFAFGKYPDAYLVIDIKGAGQMTCYWTFAF